MNDSKFGFARAISYLTTINRIVKEEAERKANMTFEEREHERHKENYRAMECRADFKKKVLIHKKRNVKCFCGSGKKLKNCCYISDYILNGMILGYEYREEFGIKHPSYQYVEKIK